MRIGIAPSIGARQDNCHLSLKKGDHQAAGMWSKFLSDLAKWKKKFLRQPWSAIKQKGEIRRTVKNQELLAAVVQIRRT